MSTRVHWLSIQIVDGLPLARLDIPRIGLVRELNLAAVDVLALELVDGALQPVVGHEANSTESGTLRSWKFAQRLTRRSAPCGGRQRRPRLRRHAAGP